MHGEAWETRGCMGGKGKHDRRMGMHGEARESMIDACGGMGGKGKHKRRMGMHGDAWGGVGIRRYRTPFGTDSWSGGTRSFREPCGA